MVIYYWKLDAPAKLIFKMIRVDNLLLETPDSRRTNFQYNQRAAGVCGINDSIHLSEGDLSKCFLPFTYDVKAAFSILATLTSLEQ